ncbi:MAG: hypothetical protein ACFCD0_22565 [Gemmataceae bacterium]
MKLHLLIALGIYLALVSSLHAQSSKKFQAPKASEVLPLLQAGSPDALEGPLRTVILKHLPTPLYEASPGWGRTRMVAHALKWKRRGIFLRPKIYKTPRNHGAWKKYRLLGHNLNDTLLLDIRNVKFSQPLTMHFTVFLSFDARAEYYHHQWNSGVRIYAGSVKAKLRAKAYLDCVATAHLEKGKSWIPDAVFQAKVVRAHLAYDNLRVYHVPGFGGSAARIIGEAFHGALKQWHPSVERRLLAKGNAAIVRAADTKEIRVNMGRAFEKAFGKLKWK